MEEKVFGLPAWAALLTLAGAGVVGYLIFFRNSQPSGGGATGYSAQGLAVMQNPDESATMALQNQLLSQIGVNMENSFTELGSQVGTGFSSIGTSLAGLSGQISTLQAGQTSQTQSILSSLTNWGNALSSQMTQEQQTLVAGQQSLLQQDIANGAGIDKIKTDLTAMQGTLGTISQQQQQTGAFLGWEFYQLPDRYTPFIPTALNPAGWQ
jgi:hypothetical protein